MQLQSIAVALLTPSLTTTMLCASAVVSQPPSGSTSSNGNAYTPVFMDDRAVFVSPFLPVAKPSVMLPAGARQVDFLPELVDMIPPSSTFDLVQFPMPDGTLRDLWLTEFNVIDDDATFVVMDTDEKGNPVTNYDMAPKVRTFSGRVTGIDDSLVYLAFSDTIISGMIRIGDSMYSISNGPRGSMPVVISDIDNLPEGAINWAQYTCQVREAAGAGGNAGEGAGEGGLAALATCKKIELAFETDNEFRNLFASNQDALDYATQIAAGMNTIYYEQENLFPVVTFLRIWSPGQTDPWSGGSSGAQLDQFVNAWGGGGGPAGSNPRDLAHLISARDLGGGVAYLNAVCNPQIGFAVSGNINGSFPFPLLDNSPQNWDIMVTTHEMGHNCACNHTHDLGVDNCVGGACISNGTIMSYCHLCPGGLANVKLEFAPANIAQMDGFLGGAACLSTPCPIFDPSNFRASDGSFIDTVRLSWNAPAVAALRFEVQRRVSGVGAFTDLNANVSPTATTLNDNSTLPGAKFEYRIRAVKIDGTPSDWIGPDEGFKGFPGPTNLVASDGLFSDRVALEWVIPFGVSETAQRTYAIYRSAPGAGPLKIAESSGNSSLAETYADTGTYDPLVFDQNWPDIDADGNPGPPEAPEPGLIYSYEVRLETDGGVSAPASDTGFRAIPGPFNVKATGSLNSNEPPMTDRIRLSWGLPGPVNRIYIQRATAGGPFVQVASLAGGTLAWSDLNVLHNVSYTYRVQTFSNLNGLSAPSEPDLGFKLQPPSIASASDGTSSNVTVTWVPPTTWTPTAYQVWRKPQGRAPWPSSPIATDIPAGGLNQFTDTSATPGVVYVYAVAAKSFQFNSYSARGSTNTGYATIQPPTGLTASDGTFPGFIELSWTPVGATSGVFFDVYRRRANTNDSFALLTTSLQALTFDTSAVAGVVYEYHVKTRASNGATSAASASDTGFR